MDQAIFVSLQANKKGQYIFLRPDALNDLLIKWRTKADVPEHISVSPHKWRHAWASKIASSKDVFALQALMGHTDIRTTLIYVHQNIENLRELVTTYRLI